MPLRIIAGLIAAVVAAVFAAGSAGAAPVRYAIDATLDPAARTIAGSVEIVFENTAAVPLDEVALVLYPNRFARPDPGVNDVNRAFVYPREEFVAGGMTVEGIAACATWPTVEDQSQPVPLGKRWFRPLDGARSEAIGDWADTLLRARLPSALAPGESGVVRAVFRTVLPERYGPFGVSEGRVVALGGWFPQLAALGRYGAWQPATPPAPTEVSGKLRVPRSYAVVLGTEVHPVGHDETIAFTLRGPTRQAAGAAASYAGGAWPALLASPEYRSHQRDIDGVRVLLLELPSRRALVFPPRPPHAAQVLDALARIVQARPAGLPARPAGLPARAEPLVVVEAPLHLELTAPAGPGVAVVSDRILRVHALLRGFHERELAAAVYAALLRAAVAGRESAADAPWLTEGIAAALADRYLAAARPRHRTVYDWINLFNVFAIVDRFESAPKIPFGRAFFPEARHADELGDGVESFARDRPPGRTILTKLRNEIGGAAYGAAIDRYLAGGESFRAAAAGAAGQRLDWLFDEWTAAYPSPLDYALLDADLNRSDVSERPPETSGSGSLAEPHGLDAGVPDGEPPGGSAPATPYHHRLTVVRSASRPIREPVEIELRGRGGERARLNWDDDASRAVLELATPWRTRRATLDPDRRLLEDTRADNVRPPLTQVVLDSADVTVTSSEFAVSGLFVGRRRYDYTKDLGLIAYLSDRSVGMHLGPRWHFGAANDAASYRHNLFGFYTLAGLRGDFGDDSRPGLHTDGTLGGLGLRYDYTDEISYDNPTTSTKLRLFADWYDGTLGSSFDYVDWGARASVVRPVLTPRTLVAVQLLNAFSTPTGGSRVPNQGRYSLGGDLAIRGIPVQARLGENVALARVELRQTAYPEMDLNLGDVLVLRHGQLRLFVDAGRVEDRRGSLYRASDFAVGVGIGAAAFYDFMGFFPAVAYVAVAQRVDRFAGVDNSVQFLFGTRQAF
jgi:hypothetical protein